MTLMKIKMAWYRWDFWLAVTKYLPRQIKYACFLRVVAIAAKKKYNNHPGIDDFSNMKAQEVAEQYFEATGL